MNRKTIQTCVSLAAVAFAVGLVSVNARAADPKVTAPPLVDPKLVAPKSPAANLSGPKLGAAVPAIYCADPSVTAINFAITSRTGPGTGRVGITAIAKNLGKDRFEVGMLTLYKQIPGRPYVELAHTNVPTLAPGAEVTAFFEERNWNASDEFPPTYKATFIGDPDGPTGSIPSHRDCNTHNNELTRSGVDINTTLFR
jgi:hypothetical protein